jgi:GT2 family glycosyltransferase
MVPICAVVPTINRGPVLERTLSSLEAQSALPAQLIVVDGSADDQSRKIVETWSTKLRAIMSVSWQKAATLGAAAQRNQGIASANQPFIWFFDDDILFEPECVLRLWRALESDPGIGGVSAMITNQHYQKPGLISRMMFAMLHGCIETTYAGRVIGPAINLLPDDRDDQPEVVPVEWLNTTCTIYRRKALPNPAFDSVFTGYSLMEDLTLSLRVAKTWRIANARTARIFHDSQPGAHKASAAALSQMDLVNRHYVMTTILGRKGLRDYLGLLLWEVFQLISVVASRTNRRNFMEIYRGKWRATRILAGR